MLVRDTTRPPDSRELEWQLKQLQHDHPLSFDMDRRMGHFSLVCGRPGMSGAEGSVLKLG